MESKSQFLHEGECSEVVDPKYMGQGRSPAVTERGPQGHHPTMQSFAPGASRFLFSVIWESMYKYLHQQILGIIFLEYFI